MPLRLLVAGLVALPAAGRDAHSFANPEHVRVRHLDLDLTTDFDKQVIRGTATLKIERATKDDRSSLILDTRGLKIEAVETTTDGTTFAEADHKLGKADPLLG